MNIMVCITDMHSGPVRITSFGDYNCQHSLRKVLAPSGASHPAAAPLLML